MAIRYNVYTTNYNCPHCGVRYDSTSTSDSIFGTGNRQHRFRYFVNNPIIKCKFCGGTFIDDRVKEYLMMSDEERKEYFNNYSSKGPVVGFSILFGITGLFTIGSISGGIWPLLIVALVVGHVGLIPLSVWIARKNRISKRIFDQTIINSLNRCKNKDHLYKIYSLNKGLYPLSDLELMSNPGYEEINALVLDLTESSKNKQGDKKKETIIPKDTEKGKEVAKKSSNYYFCNHYLPDIYFNYTNDFEECFTDSHKLAECIGRILAIMREDGFDITPLANMKPFPKLDRIKRVLGIILELPTPNVEPECNFVFFGFFDMEPVYFESELYGDGTFGLCGRDKNRRHINYGNQGGDIKTIDKMWESVVSLKKDRE